MKPRKSAKCETVRKLCAIDNDMNPGYFILAAIDLKPYQMPMFLHISARVCRARRFPLPDCPGQVKLYQSGKLIWTDFSSLFDICRSKNFKILGVGQVMILRKGEPWFGGVGDLYTHQNRKVVCKNHNNLSIKTTASQFVHTRKTCL